MGEEPGYEARTLYQEMHVIDTVILKIGPQLNWCLKEEDPGSCITRVDTRWREVGQYLNMYEQNLKNEFFLSEDE